MSLTDEDTSWQSFSHLTATSDFETLLQSVNDPKYQFLKGLSVFRPRQASNEGSVEAQTISKELGLDVNQAEVLLKMIKTSSIVSDQDLITRSKDLYFNERLALLRTLRTIFEEDYKASCVDLASIVKAVKSFQSSGLVSGLLKELITQLTACSENGVQTLKPLIAGDQEIECLVEILMFSFRKHPCLAGSLMELFKSIKSSLGCFASNQDLQIKLTLLPMLAFGFWQALENARLTHGRPLQHNLQSEFIELDGFFSLLAYGQGHPLETTMQLTWQVFRRFYSIASSKNGSDAPGGVYVGKMDASLMPGWIRKVLSVISGHTLSKECLLMMMSALMYYNSTFQDRTHSFEFFEVFAEILQNDFYLCERLFDCQTHWKLRKLFLQTKHWFCFSVYPLMTLLTAFAFPDFAARISNLVSFDNFGMVVLLKDSEFRNIQLEADSGRVLSTARIYPSLGTQMVILQDTPGRIWDAENTPNWIIPIIPQTQFVKWENYQFRTILLFKMHQLMIQTKTGNLNSHQIQQEAVLDAMSLVRFLSGYLWCNKETGMDHDLRLESGQLIQMIRDWMGVFLESGFEISSLLYLLKDLAEEQPYQVLTALRQTALFLSNTTGSINIYRILSLQGFEDQLDQVLPVADALLRLLSELMVQGFQMEETCNWVEVIWKELIPKLKMHSSISVKNEILLKLYISILRSVLPFFKSDNRESPLRRQYLEALKTGFCIEDCMLGILNLIPDELDQIKDLNPLQLELVTNTCQVLSSLLEDPDLQEDYLTRLVTFLQQKGYWNTKSPAAILLLYIMRAFRTSELTKEDGACSAAVIDFFSAFLDRLQNYGIKSKAEPVFLSSLPMVQQQVHPDFRKALVLESVYHGKEVNRILIKSAVNLLITASKQDSEFFKFLVYPSKMDPGIESCDNSLLDVLWTGLQSSRGLWKTDPELLLILLKGISAVQNCKENDRTSWEALIGQNEFNQCLLDLLQQCVKINNSTAEQEATRESVLALSLQIIQKEVQDSPVNQHLTQKLPLDFRKTWKTWKQLLNDSIQTPISQQEDEKMLYVLANCACFEIYNSLKTENSSFDCFPFMREIRKSVEEILGNFGVNCGQIVEYVLDITTNVSSGLQLQHALLNPASQFEFLSAKAMPGSVLLDLMVSCDSRWTMGRTGSRIGQEKVPKWITVQFRTYRMLQEFLNGQFETYFSCLPIRDDLLMHWRNLNRFILSSSSFEAALAKTKVKELVPEVMISLKEWLRIANGVVDWSRSNDDQLYFRSRGISQLCLKWSLHFIVNLSGILLDCVELLPVLSTASLEPSSSPAPSILLRQDSQIDDSFFDFRQILQILQSWFEVLSSMKGLPEEQENQDSIQSGSKTLLLLIWLLKRNLSDQLSSLDSESSFQVILTGLLDLLDPRSCGFEVSNGAIGGLIGFSEFCTQWSEEILQTFHSEIQPGPLLAYIKQNQNLLLKSPGFQSWSINFFRALEFVWNQRPLRKLFESEMFIEALWQYCQSLFNSEGLIQLDQPYSEANERFGAFDHWLILLPLIGKILNVYFTPDKVISLHEPFYYSLLRLFDQISVLLSSAFPSYLTLEFGIEVDPLTLARVERIEVNLDFALGTHDILASRGVHCLQQYNLRRQEVSTFIQICDGILHRTSRTGFLCGAISPEEHRLDKISLPFNIHAGWFGLTKNRILKNRIQSEEILSKFSWLLAKKVYLCLNKGMQYLKISSPLSNEESGQDWMLSKDLLLRLQSDCLMICRNLVDSIGAGTDAVLRMEIRDLSRCLTSIVNLSTEFLTGWGYIRHRRYSEQFHTQLDVMHQLQLLVE